MSRGPGRGRRRALSAVGALLAATWSLAVPAAPAAAQPSGGGAVAYTAPVDGPVLDPFRPPPRPWQAGNRGVDLGATPGGPVRTAGPGVVAFAGPVAGALHVTVRHPDGLRTSYSFLASIEVVAGQRLAAGARIGTSGAVLHWGVRDPEGRYLDPMGLLGTPVAAVLVPGGDDGSIHPEPSGLRALADAVADGLARHGATRLGWPSLPAVPRLPLGASLRVPPGLAAWAAQLAEVHPAPHLGRVLVGLHERLSQPCTATDVPAPPPAGRRIAVLVGGFGSSSEHAGIDGVDTDSLGYRPDDVLRFSYRGGRTPPPGGPGRPASLAALASTTYDPDDSQGDLVVSADELAALLRDVSRAAPGVPVDVLAHSQGGLVARLALDRADRGGRLPSEVDLLATFGTPHQGADLATTAANLAGDPEGAALLDLARRAGLPADPSRPALGQLAETSAEVASVAGHPPPAGVRLVSISARGDLTVPAPRTAVVGGAEAVVPLVGPSAHDSLAADPRAAREVALARAGLPPTCRPPAEVLADLVVGEGVAWAQDGLGAGLGSAFRILGPPVPG